MERRRRSVFWARCVGRVVGEEEELAADGGGGGGEAELKYRFRSGRARVRRRVFVRDSVVGNIEACATDQVKRSEVYCRRNVTVALRVKPAARKIVRRRALGREERRVVVEVMREQMEAVRASREEESLLVDGEEDNSLLLSWSLADLGDSGLRLRGCSGSVSGRRKTRRIPDTKKISAIARDNQGVRCMVTAARG